MQKNLESTIILCGIKHCGKTTHGRRLALIFRCRFFDTDDEIEKQTGRKVREIYRMEGEDVFRSAETEVCNRLAAEAQSEPCIIATGGGICNNSDALKVLHTAGIFIFLDVGEKIPSDRIVQEAVYNSDGSYSNLPAYIAKENPHTEREIVSIFHCFYVDRVSKYKDIADFIVCLQQDSVRKNTERILTVINSTDKSV